ncbi:putative F-box domain-containing protein [Tanacetum coccineum]
MVVFDVVEDILLRVAVKDLIRYKSVCKSWYSLISSSRFVELHLKHTCDNNDYDLEHRRIAMPTVWKIPDDFQNNIWKVVGSSNGLVCISPLLRDPLILVNNPCTGEVRELPMAPLISEKIIGKLSVSFGYDSSTDDYKVVMGIKKGLEGAIVQVFSLKSNSWKLIGDVKYWFMYNKPGILFNGALHWFVFDYNNETRTVILSFDLSREDFNVIPQPNDTKYTWDLLDSVTTMGIVENQLSIILTNVDNPLKRNIWVMRSYNVGHSWELLPNDCEMKYDVVHYMKMYDCTSPMKKRLSFFCDDNTCSSRSGKYVDTHIFVQSLVSPYVNYERPSRAGSDKVAELELKYLRIHEEGKKSKCRRDPEEEERYEGNPYKIRGCHSITLRKEGGVLGRKKKSKKNKCKSSCIRGGIWRKFLQKKRVSLDNYAERGRRAGKKEKEQEQVYEVISEKEVYCV